MRPRLIAVVLVSALALAACVHTRTPAPVDTSADEAAIKATGSAWFDAFNAGDVEKVVGIYADDAVVMPPNVPAITSKEALRTYIASETASGKQAGIQILDGESTAGVSGDLGWHQGAYTVKAGDGTTVDAGSYMEVWKKRDGKWLIVRDIWNSSNKPAPPPEAPR